ncbi:MAG: SDR family oxidoreductase [Alphaproteobacteria bacterium]|nr:SDR family oxidoreductase [Alphaproteobacteria bacterium]
MAKKVLILGASRGIGRELARQYKQAGWHVIATGRLVADVHALQSEVDRAFALDVADPASVSSLAWQLDGETLDLVVHVAGIIDRHPFSDPVTQERFDRIMHTNVLGVLQAMPQVAPLLKPGAGVLAVISSIMGSLERTVTADSVLYRVSKAAVNMVVRSAQAQYPDLTVVALHPGWVRTDMGGSGAALDVSDSAAHLRRLMGGLKPSHKGQYINHDGSAIPW